MSETAQDARFRGRFEDEGPGLRSRAARGTIINSGFEVGLAALTFVRGFAIAALLTPGEYGIWGILAIAIGTLAALKDVGVADKYIQQDEEDQELAFQRAFTLDTLLNLVLLALLVAAAPLITLAYGRPELLLPALVLLTSIPSASFQAPMWIFNRRMKFGTSRALAAINPVVSTALMVPLAIAGLGYWSLVLGTVAGFWVMGLVAVKWSPYKIAWRYDRGSLRTYWHFSWPLFVNQVTSLVVAQSTIFIAATTVSVEAAGAITLAATIAMFADRVDTVVTDALYPAICAVKDRADLLLESFVKSNRLAIMWGIPFGMGLALFAADLVHHLLGDQWAFAIGLLQMFGLLAASKQIGFNWHAFYRAVDNTRPIATLNVIQLGVFLVTVIPGLLLGGLHGYIIGTAIDAFVYLVLRLYFLVRLFPDFAVLRHVLRALAPSVPAVVSVLGLRALESGGRSLTQAASEVVVYLGVTAAATVLLERPLLDEMFSYLRRVPDVRPAG